MAKAKTTLNLALLAALLTATEGGGFLHLSDAAAAPLLAHKPVLIEQNPSPEGVNDKGERQSRLTAEGIAFAKANPPKADSTSAPAGEAAKVKPTFNVVSNIPLPEIKRGGGVGTSTYPFDSMENGQSFFVAATDDKPEPAKSLASTVSSATRRYAVQEGTKADPKDANKQVPNMVQKRKFVIREVEDGAPWGEQFKGKKGAAIFRTL